MTRIRNLALALATAAASFTASPTSATEDTEFRAGFKCDWGFNNCNTRGGATYSNTQTHGSHTETNKLDFNADKDGLSLDGSHNNSRNDNRQNGN